MMCADTVIVQIHVIIDFGNARSLMPVEVMCVLTFLLPFRPFRNV
jgi:hypothetical protein